MVQIEPAIRIREIIQEMALGGPGMADLTDAALLREQLHFDSLSLTILMFRVQEEFDLSLADMRKNLVRAHTIGDLVGAVERLLARATPATDPGSRTESP